MDAANLRSWVDEKRKSLSEKGLLIPIVVSAAMVVVVAFVAFLGGGNTESDKGVNVVVNLNERRKMARRDARDVVTPAENAETPKAEAKPARKKKDKKVEEKKDEPEPKPDEDGSEDDATDPDDSGDDDGKE